LAPKAPTPPVAAKKKSPPRLLKQKTLWVPAMQSPVEIKAKGLSPWQCNFCMKWHSSNCRQTHLNQVHKKEVAKQQTAAASSSSAAACFAKLYSPNQKEVAPAKQLGTSTDAQKQASIADVLADFSTQLNQVMACIQQLPSTSYPGR
jgi:hypothetical protein